MGAWTWRRLTPGETNLEFLLGVLYIPLCLAAGAAAAAIPPSRAPACYLRLLTGIPCPTCGTLRSLRLLLHGHPAAAFAMQPLVTLLLAASALYAAYAWAVVIGRLPRLRPAPGRRVPWGWIALAALVAVGLNWLYIASVGPAARR